MDKIKISVKTTNLELSGELQSYIDQKINSIGKFFSLNHDEEAIANVEVEKTTGQHHKQGQIFRAEINLAYKGNSFRTESTQEDIRVAIEIATDEMIRRVRKTKERKIDLIRRGGNAIKKMLRFGKNDPSL